MKNSTRQSAPLWRRRLARLRSDDTGLGLLQAVAGVAVVAILTLTGSIAASNVIQSSGTIMVQANRETYALSLLNDATSSPNALKAQSPTTVTATVDGKPVPVSTMVTLNGSVATIYVALPRAATVAAGTCNLNAPNPLFVAPSRDLCITRKAMARPDVATRAPQTDVGDYSAGASSLVPTAQPENSFFANVVREAGTSYRYTFHVQNVTRAGVVQITGPDGVIREFRVDRTTNSDFYGDIPAPSEDFDVVGFRITAAASVSGAFIYEVR